MSRPLLAAALCMGFANAQDVIHYKFESGGGSRVINYASGDPTAPREGVISTAGPPLAGAWVPGRFGDGISAGPNSPASGYEVNTLWKYQARGDLTIAFFLRMMHPIGPYGTICGNLSVGHWFGMDMSGQAGTRGWLTLHWNGGTYRTVRLRRDIETPARARWVHIAVVVEPSKGVVQWFVDGTPQLRQGVSGLTPIVNSTNRLRIGNRNESYWRFDEFRVSQRAVAAAEIREWATREQPAHTAFGTGCFPFGRPAILDGAAGGLPRVGNTSYRLDVYGLPQSLAVLLLGSNNRTINGAPLPLDLGFLDPALAGCFLRTSAELTQFGVVGATGTLSFPTPIPNSASTAGVRVYSQAVLQSPALNRHMSTNAYATFVGQ